MEKNKVIIIVSIIIISVVISITSEIISKYKGVQETNSEVTNNYERIIIDLTDDENSEYIKIGPEENIEEQCNEEVENKESNLGSEIKYYIKVNYIANVVNIYIKDENGEFTKPYKAMVCSTGVATPTSGVYKMSDRGEWGMMVGNVWAQYYVRICGSILFHSVPYTIKDNGCLEYWEYDKLGTTASAGCVRLTVQDAKWIYDNCIPGTEVEFYADSNPGPLGKPTAQKISDEDEDIRGWDPTDSNIKNPWKYHVHKDNTNKD